jgi:hypothetical protein
VTRATQRFEELVSWLLIGTGPLVWLSVSISLTWWLVLVSLPGNAPYDASTSCTPSPPRARASGRDQVWIGRDDLYLEVVYRAP